MLRAETGSIVIGARTNVQDNAVVHTDARSHVVIGEDVTIGHAAIIHGEHSLSDRTLILLELGQFLVAALARSSSLLWPLRRPRFDGAFRRYGVGAP